MNWTGWEIFLGLVVFWERVTCRIRGISQAAKTKIKLLWQ